MVTGNRVPIVKDTLIMKRALNFIIKNWES